MASTKGLLALEVEIEALIRAERLTLKREEAFTRLLLLGGTVLTVAALSLLGAETFVTDLWIG
jgi:hypothetical protein